MIQADNSNVKEKVEKTSGIGRRKPGGYQQYLLNLRCFRMGEKNNPGLERAVRDKTGKLVSLQARREFMRTNFVRRHDDFIGCKFQRPEGKVSEREVKKFRDDMRK